MREVFEKAVGTLVLLDAVVVRFKTERASIRSNDAVTTPTVSFMMREGRQDGREEEQKDGDESEQHCGQGVGRRLAQ